MNNPGKKGGYAISLKICVLGSGSSGNSIYLTTPHVSLLIDAGLSAAQICKRLKSIGEDAAKLQGIVISHEHGDHTQGIRVLARRFNIPIYLNHQTHSKLDGNLEGVESIFNFSTGQNFSIGGIELHPFSVPHDAADPVGFTVQYKTHRVGVALDLGYVTHLVREKLRKNHVLILESNYDDSLLKSGPYPWALKQRLQSRHGHLSNKAAGKLLSELLHSELKHVVLGHISQTNNHPKLAYKQSQAILNEAPDCRVQLSVTHQRQVGQVIELR